MDNLYATVTSNLSGQYGFIIYENGKCVASEYPQYSKEKAEEEKQKWLQKRKGLLK